MSNYYEILAVSKDASDIEIKQSFRKLSLIYHPDKDNSIKASKKYEDIMTAYSTLEDKTKRSIYDKTLETNNNRFHYNNTKTTQELVSVHEERCHHNAKPPILTTQVNISLEQAYCGCQCPIEIERNFYDSDGYKSREKERIYITIDPGIDDGEIIYIKNKGHETSQGDIGNIKVYINVQEHDVFKRNGLDIIMTKSLSFEESLCGFLFHVPLLNGKTLCIRNAIGDVVLNGAKKILRGKGIMRNNITGNLIINFTVIQPNRLNEELALAIKELIVKNT